MRRNSSGSISLSASIGREVALANNAMEHTNDAKVVVVGQGYVGLPLALRAVEAGHHVVGFDLSCTRIDRLRAAESFIDDISNDDLKEAIETGRYLATDRIEDCDDFDIAVICVPTPLRDGTPELSYVLAAAESIGSALKPGACVILESTTYPGTTEELLVPALEERSGLRAGLDFHVGFSPERIDPGNATYSFARTPKVISGIDAASLERVRSFYAGLVDEVVPVSSPKVAELTKLLENTFRHVNIALVNELAVYANGLGIDIWEVIDAAATKPFGFMAFRPGPGVGGHCLPIDPSYLSWKVRRQLGTSFRFIELANDINEHMPDYVVRRIGTMLNDQCQSIKSARLLLLGMSYKRNSGDARESPAMRVADLLTALGAHVRIADPVVEAATPLPGVRVEPSPEELAAADLVVVLVDHDDFEWDTITTHASRIFDTRHCVRGDNVEYL